jgi:heme O synthase-like polyprenyltransferase
MEVSIMNKEEILAKSREEYKCGDEREIEIMTKKLSWMIIFIVTTILLVFYNYTEHSFPVLSALLDGTTIFFAVKLGTSVYKYYVSKNKTFVYDILLFIALTVCNIIMMILEVL